MKARKEDKYACFKDLAAGEIEGVDYGIRLVIRLSPISVIAPHGGAIERMTSEIAAAIAADAFSLYCFEGLIPGRPHRDLHISANRFDEPQGSGLARASEIVIGVHGRNDGAEPRSVWVGGLKLDLRDRVIEALIEAGFSAEARQPGQSLAGAHLDNICNRGSRGGGVQLEIPRTLRDELAADPARLDRFGTAVRAGIRGQRLPPAPSAASP